MRIYSCEALIFCRTGDVATSKKVYTAMYIRRADPAKYDRALVMVLDFGETYDAAKRGFQSHCLLRVSSRRKPDTSLYGVPRFDEIDFRVFHRRNFHFESESVTM